MSNPDPGYSRPDDQGFVRRCRIVAVGLLRLFALVATWLAVESALRGLLSSPFGTTTFPPRYRFDAVATLLALAPVASGLILWFMAPPIARLAFRMPPGRHQCPKCKYPVQGLGSDRCPECGTRIK